MVKAEVKRRRLAVVAGTKVGRMSNAAIARATGENPKFVARTLARWEETGDVEDRPRTGRPRKSIRPSDVRRIKLKKTGSTRRLARELSARGEEKVSRMTVWRRAGELKLRSRVRPKRPLHTRANRSDRLAFANKSRRRDYWKKVVAIDEKTVPLYSDTRTEWVEEGEEPSPRETIKWPGGLKVWAGTSWKGKSRLHFIPTSFKGQDYADFLEREAIPDLMRLYPYKTQPPTLLQDREGFHTAKVVQKTIKKSPIQAIDRWPSHSPDLNWQENVWEMFMQGVRERNPITFEGLKKVMEEEWEKIPMTHIRNCIRSMPHRLRQVIASGGGDSGY
jgi:transposase